MIALLSIFYRGSSMFMYLFALQAMIIMAFNELDTPLQLFDAVIFEDVSSVFVTSSVLKLLQGIYRFLFLLLVLIQSHYVLHYFSFHWQRNKEVER